MSITTKIKEYHFDNNTNMVPGKSYFVGMDLTKMIPYIDTGNLHEVKSFGWIEYLFNHTGNGLTYNILYDVMYDYKASKAERAWFNSKCSDLFKLGFEWSESSGSFFMRGVWSAYWEQVNRYNKKEWMGYVTDIMKAIESKPSTSR